MADNKPEDNTAEDQSQVDESTTATTTAEQQGEVAVDKGADSRVLGDDTSSDTVQAKNDVLESARQQGLVNHQADQPQL